MDDPTNEELHNFVMPEVVVGTPVTYYPTGMLEGSDVRVGFIIRISRSGRNVVVRTADGGHFESVRHIDDPKLKLNVDHREAGAWDFPEFHKAALVERQGIEIRLDRLEGRESTSPPAPETIEEPYSSLRSRAIELGIEFKGNPKRQWLEIKVAEYENQPQEQEVNA
jgi:hypothetical protein